MQKIDTRLMTICAFLIALNIILSRIIAIPGLISFGGFPIIFGGIVFGPVVGGIVGAIGDIVSFIVRPTGAFMPHFVLTSALTGIIPGLIIKLLQNKLSDSKLWKVFIAVLIGQLITTVLMVPYFRLVLFAHPFVVTTIRAAQKQMINIPAYAILINVLIKALAKSQTLKISDYS